MACCLAVGVANTPVRRVHAAPCQEAAAPEKISPPNKSKAREKELVIRGIFAAQYKDRTVEGKSQLADELLDTARQTTDDPDSMYVLLSEAIGIAVNASNTPAACQSTELLIEKFDVDATKLRSQLIDSISKSVNDPDDWSQLKTHIRPLIDEAIDDDQFKVAEALLQSLNRGGRRVNDMFFVETSGRRLKTLKMMAREYSSTKSDRARLEKDPDDSAANQAVGEFRCFWKRDFANGLANLAKGNDEVTRSLAIDELAGFADNHHRIQIADRWWTLSQKWRGQEADTAASHAVEHYRATLKEAQGIEKKRIELRIKQYDSAKLARLAANIQGIFGKPWRVTWQNGQVPWERTVFAADGTMQSFAQNRNWNNTFVIENNVIRVLNQTKEFVFTVEFYGSSLVCRKFDVKTGQLIDRGAGVLLKE